MSRLLWALWVLRRWKRRLSGQCACPWCECPALPFGDRINRCDECADHPGPLTDRLPCTKPWCSASSHPRSHEHVK